MNQTILNAHNVLLFLLYHIKQIRAHAGEAQIITADLNVWETAIFALRKQCNSTLLYVFKFRRWGLIFLSKSLEEAFRHITTAGIISAVSTEHDGYPTTDYILRDELNKAILAIRVDSTTNPLACYVSDITSDPKLCTDYQAMKDETRELAAALLPMLTQRIEVKIQNHKKEPKTDE